MSSTATAAGYDEPRTCLLGGELNRRTGVVSWGVLAVAALAAIGLVVVVTTRSRWLLAAMVLVGVAAWWARRRRTVTGEAWTGTVVEEVRARVALRTGADTYEPPAADATGARPLPREVGPVTFVAASAARDGPELAVARHGLCYLSTVLEVVGGGDGLRETREVNAQGARFGRFLYALSRPHVPIDQVDVSTRVLPVDGSAYREWIAQRLRDDLAPELRSSMLGLSEQVAWTGEAYRTFVTICMPTDALSARCARTGPVTPTRMAEAAFEVTGLAAREATRAGLRVRAGLGPRRLGALIRHLYTPSWDMDDLDGITGPRDGFQPYRAAGRPYRAGFEVLGADGSSWWHATAAVPRDGWPMHPVGVRWLEALVTDVTPATIRTVTAQHRLVSKVETRERARVALTLDEADIRAQERKGQVSTGEREAQAAAPARVLSDLLYADAAGDRPALRVTVSAPDPVALAGARERLDSAGQDNGLTRLRWYDTRHHHGHLTTLPLGRGIAR